MSMFIEDIIIDRIEVHLYETGIKMIRSKFIRTNKNMPVDNLFDRLGYSLDTDDGEVKNYSLEIKNRPERKKFGTAEIVWN